MSSNTQALATANMMLDELHATGYYPALQVCVRHRGQIVLDRAIGQYRPIEQESWRPVTPQTRFMLFSISKCVAAICTHILFDRGLIHVDDPIHWYIPEFAQHGKEHVTLRHVLTHTAGIPMLRWKLTDALIRDWDRIIRDLCESKLLYFPGRMTSYHMLSGGYLLGEVIRRVDGRSLREFAQQELLEPLGFETFNFGIDSSWYDRTAKSERVEPLPPAPLLKAINQMLQLDLEQTLAVMNRPAVFESVIPSGNIVGTAEETSRFFQMLLEGGQLDGARVLSEEQVKRATMEQVVAKHDLTLLLTPARYSLGFMLGRKRSEINVFGKDTAQAFGHLGFTRNLGWADPARQIAVGFLTSSKITYPRSETITLRRFQNAINSLT